MPCVCPSRSPLERGSHCGTETQAPPGRPRSCPALSHPSRAAWCPGLQVIPSGTRHTHGLLHQEQGSSCALCNLPGSPPGSACRRMWHQPPLPCTPGLCPWTVLGTRHLSSGCCCPRPCRQLRTRQPGVPLRHMSDCVPPAPALQGLPPAPQTPAAQPSGAEPRSPPMAMDTRPPAPAGVVPCHQCRPVDYELQGQKRDRAPRPPSQGPGSVSAGHVPHAQWLHTAPASVSGSLW